MIPKAYSVGIYARLSKDDERSGESVSIENQKAILTQHVEAQTGWVLHKIYVDDGWSGTNFQRPSFQKMLADAKDGVINLIICKDLSRFGRNYIEVGQFTDYIFPTIGCRFVALNDSVDTIHNNNDIMPYKNLMNEFHSRDTSKKVRTILKARAESGKFMGSFAPYGFRKNPQDKHQLIIDDQTAPVVRRIFAMRCAGKGYYAIACALNEDGIIAPRAAWYAEHGGSSSTMGTGLWSSSAIKLLMQNEAYIGHMVQGKQGKVSFKTKKIVKKDPEDWIRVENTHEPIIDQATWDQVQRINARKHRPKAISNGSVNSFAGLLYCADCGSTMRYQSKKNIRKDGSVEYSALFLCGSYSRSGKSACTAHIIQEKALTQLVLEDIRRNAVLVALDEQAVIREIIRQKSSIEASDLALHRKELRHLTSRLAELDKLIQCLYEDRVKGTVPETVFHSLMEKYEQERLGKKERATLLEQKITESRQDWSNVTEWANIIKRHTNLESLNAETLLELIDRIEIGAATVENNQRICNITVYYRFVENVDLSMLKLEADYGQAG
ncbi:recombinase family protein [Ruminococcaceae bacterium OttesenSCG-928-L11]|nr:recombinase family protein [Ruminococcaceae bacterium OttesenSCG-928-L11]